MKWRFPLLLLFSVSLAWAGTEVPSDLRKPEEIAEYQSGVVAAQKDIQNGLYKYEIVGAPLPADFDVAKKAKTRYGITVVFHGCIAGPRVNFDRGYLDTVVSALKKKHGFDPVEKLFKEASAN